MIVIDNKIETGTLNYTFRPVASFILEFRDMEDIACTVKVRENKLKRKGARQWHCGCNSIITVLRQDQIIIILAYRGKRWYFLFFK